MLTFNFFFYYSSIKSVFSPWGCPSLLGAVLCSWFWKLWCVFMWTAKDFSGVQVQHDDVVNRFIFVLGWHSEPGPGAPHCVRYTWHRAGDFPAQRAPPQAHSQGELPNSSQAWHWYVPPSSSFLRVTLRYTFPWINYSFLGKLFWKVKGTQKRGK